MLISDVQAALAIDEIIVGYTPVTWKHIMLLIIPMHKIESNQEKIINSDIQFVYEYVSHFNSLFMTEPKIVELEYLVLLVLEAFQYSANFEGHGDDKTLEADVRKLQELLITIILKSRIPKESVILIAFASYLHKLFSSKEEDFGQSLRSLAIHAQQLFMDKVHRLEQRLKRSFLEALFANLCVKYSKGFQGREATSIDELEHKEKIDSTFKETSSILNYQEIKDLLHLKSNMENLKFNMHEHLLKSSCNELGKVSDQMVGHDVAHCRRNSRCSKCLVSRCFGCSYEKAQGKAALEGLAYSPLRRPGDIEDDAYLQHLLLRDQANFEFEMTDILSSRKNQQLICLELLNIFVCDPLLDRASFKERIQTLKLGTVIPSFLGKLFDLEDVSNCSVEILAIGIATIMKHYYPKCEQWSKGTSKILTKEYPNLSLLLSELASLTNTQIINEDQDRKNKWFADLRE
jgi:hypothetical protein